MNYDTISRADVIKIIKSVLSPASSLVNVAMARRQMLDRINELESKPEPHWIPVTERLPKSKEEDLEYPTVLICFENEEIMLGCFYESTKEWGTGEYFDKKCNPIAWMPLPEPMRLENK